MMMPEPLAQVQIAFCWLPFMCKERTCHNMNEASLHQSGTVRAHGEEADVDHPLKEQETTTVTGFTS